ncbi:ASPIC/UnbV domain-containing protein (plasmid) [Haloferax larsenii]|uniref:ASPIC/UnbV domain-containing protein n=1 Tax=Haloferax larsenii TaxID=302484 RepID=A0ABY5RIQ5_HALLR|nr:ASPIC/UnbV domain-containing protein [Haloferax larsenii]UVE51940.1 ASPIC/UnbV domain-containing protein [Haloferax larsenii]
MGAKVTVDLVDGPTYEKRVRPQVHRLGQDTDVIQFGLGAISDVREATITVEYRDGTTVTETVYVHQYLEMTPHGKTNSRVYG